MTHTSRRLATMAAVVASVSLLTAGLAGPVSAQDKLILDVVSLRPGDSEQAYHAFDAQVAQFEAANPDIDIVAHEYNWTGPTFTAALAGGTLPDVFTIPFTDGKSLIEQGQLADITELVNALPYASKFNPNVLATAQDADGHIFGLPRQAYGIGLQYNRDLFTQAGLDPDNPPATWDEVRAAAKTIAEKTGKAGYAEMAINNTGGWQLTAATIARGGRTQVDNGDGTYTSTINNPGTKAALQFLHDLRWVDNSFGFKYDLDWGTINQEFAAGNIGMYTSGSDVYTALVRDFGMKPEQYGLTVVPLDGADAGTLGGGDVAVVSPTIDDATKAAAVKWIDWYYMQKLMNEDAAVADAKALADQGQAVGTPVLPVLSKELYEQSLTWIEPYINVPRDQMAPFTDNIWDQTPVGEAKGKTQEIYALLDPVVQAVLTDENADIDALLTQADVDAQALLDQ